MFSWVRVLFGKGFFTWLRFMTQGDLYNRQLDSLTCHCCSLKSVTFHKSKLNLVQEGLGLRWEDAWTSIQTKKPKTKKVYKTETFVNDPTKLTIWTSPRFKMVARMIFLHLLLYITFIAFIFFVYHQYKSLILLINNEEQFKIYIWNPFCNWETWTNYIYTTIVFKEKGQASHLQTTSVFLQRL